MRIVRVELVDGRNFSVDLTEIAEDRASYYAKTYPGRTYEAAFDETIHDEGEALDWLFNNMNWFECKTLKALPGTVPDLADADVEDYFMEDAPDEASTQ